MLRKNRSLKRFFIKTSVAVIIIMLLGAWSSGMLGSLFDDTNDYHIAEDASYLICVGEKYVPAGDDFDFDYGHVGEDGETRIIKDYVKQENAGFIDNIFVYGYAIYAVPGYSDNEVVYLHTAELSNSVAEYYVKESYMELISDKTE